MTMKNDHESHNVSRRAFVTAAGMTGVGLWTAASVGSAQAGRHAKAEGKKEEEGEVAPRRPSLTRYLCRPEETRYTRWPQPVEAGYSSTTTS